MEKQYDKTVLLVMDMENGIVTQFIKDKNKLLPVKKAITAARQNNIQVIFVRVGFSAGYPEIDSNNRAFSEIKQTGKMLLGNLETDICESCKPNCGELIITKHRISAFTGSTLEIILRSQQINTLICCGISTSGVVLSTVREAFDKDFNLKVIEDACFDADSEVQQVLMKKIFPRQAEVLTADDWAESLCSAGVTQ
ncbi:cysteine hydrolase family protein [Pectinatus frisingensis]|jgi:nicotinamidase-related amidase|uniref:cysteine hydrolase family protein n=1 Tax=Pectinatus frisingensis TaxID=865 RepID=UPI0015F58770|nr:cysteine hydrolase [Pectinatus frisingensis]